MSDLKKLYLDIHNKMKSEYGFSPRALWGSKNSQEIRFDILTRCILPTNKKIKVLDVGSGLGHLNGFLIEKGYNIDYTGLEINESFYEESKRNFPEANFIKGDTSKLKKIKNSFDYSFASGIYNLGSKQDTLRAFMNDLKIISDKTHIAIGVNFLSSMSKKQDGISLYHQPQEILNLIRSNYSFNCELITDYLPNDFTVLIHK